MKKLLVFQHVGHEILGTLDPLLREAGFRIRYVNFGRDPEAVPNLNGYDAVVALGGPMNVDQQDRYPHLATEVRLLEDAIKREMPVLGICLGAQLLAKALGAPVRANDEKEIGWYDVKLTDQGREDVLLGHMNSSEKIFQWHGDTFDLPEGAELLATSDLCRNQAFRYGERVWGFQFHLEVDQPMVERWLNVPAMRTEIEELGGRIDPDRIREHTPQHIDRLHELSDRTFRGFIRHMGRRKKFATLPSR